MAYVQHVVEQIQSNVAFLVDNGHMSQQDANLCLSHLPSGGGEQSLVAATGRLAIATPPAPAPAYSATPPLPTARAVWAYNEHGTDPDDVSFRPGDIIEIVEETNADWWKGRVNGKEGLLPSNHVEKISAAASGPVRTIHAPPPPAVQPQKSRSFYRPFGAAHHGADKPPPPGAQQVNSVGLQEAPGQEAKKSKYGKYGNTMAHGAAGGVGFGAGSAIGGGLVRAIF